MEPIPPIRSQLWLLLKIPRIDIVLVLSIRFRIPLALISRFVEFLIKNFIFPHLVHYIQITQNFTLPIIKIDTHFSFVNLKNVVITSIRKYHQRHNQHKNRDKHYKEGREYLVLSRNFSADRIQYFFSLFDFCFVDESSQIVK